MSIWVCAKCDHEYDSEQGDMPHGISAGTSLQSLPEDWVCPECGAHKIDFAPIPGSSPRSGDGWTTRG